ncbi:hypothetical protein MPSEU_000598400 [Mayamaea pseudoterrestris]|nr:hypothetical protein MPSEU_000598400 [Mayamaea pseudoterrestris]
MTMLAGNDKLSNSSMNIAEMARFVPLRLTPVERSLLMVLEQALNVSEYTDLVDVTAASRRAGLKTHRILECILEIVHIATGLAVASSVQPIVGMSAASVAATTPIAIKKKDKKMLKKLKLKKKEKEKKDASAKGSSEAVEPVIDESFLQAMFEIGRRNKVLNPSSMRTTYGKLMYLLQDSQNSTVARSLGFSLHKDMLLCGSFLDDRDCTALLRDARLECAVQYISDREEDDGKKIDRAHLQALVQGKQRMLDELVEHYTSEKMPADDVRRVIESIADAVAYIQGNLRPVQRMLRYLEENFDPNVPEKGYSLTLRGGGSYTYSSNSYASKYGLSAYSSGSNEGPKLSHSHDTQYTFVWQSLRLWCKVQQNMHRLWICADEDLLSVDCPYRLFNTGQGLNRVQQCPRVRRVMQGLLNETQIEAGSSWVGLSVIHLGDRDVPNALVFIDKYTYIPRFLGPIVLFLQTLPELCLDERIDAYIQREFGSQRKLMMTLLADYFKHGFDGSGDDGGSCIDGRLTSSWNWTSRIAKKPYYHAFMLSGFQGFDGDWK